MTTVLLIAWVVYAVGLAMAYDRLAGWAHGHDENGAVVWRSGWRRAALIAVEAVVFVPIGGGIAFCVWRVTR